MEIFPEIVIKKGWGSLSVLLIAAASFGIGLVYGRVTKSDSDKEPGEESGKKSKSK